MDEKIDQTVRALLDSYRDINTDHALFQLKDGTVYEGDILGVENRHLVLRWSSGSKNPKFSGYEPFVIPLDEIDFGSLN